MDEESMVVPVENGTYNPGGGVGPIAVGVPAGEPMPTHVLVTHDALGNHVATPADAPAEGEDGDAPPAGEGEDGGDAAATPPAAGSPGPAPDEGPGGDGGTEEGAAGAE